MLPSPEAQETSGNRQETRAAVRNGAEKAPTATLPSSGQQNVVRKRRTVTTQAPAALWVWDVVMLRGPDPTEPTGEIQPGEGMGLGRSVRPPHPFSTAGLSNQASHRRLLRQWERWEVAGPWLLLPQVLKDLIPN